MKYTHFENLTQGRPDNISDAVPSNALGTHLDIANLDQLGLLTVPVLVTGATAYNAFVQPLIDRYGYTLNGVKVGGGTVGFGPQFDDDNFFRDSGQIGYNLNLGQTVTHDIHVGYQWYSDREDLIRSSNGWGLLSVPGGRLAQIPGTGQSAFYTATFQQQSTGQAAPIHSEYQSQSFELNDQIKWNNLSINVGVLASNDTLYGQGLREDSSTLSGYVSAPGHKYKMYEIPFSKMIQPRVGVTWAYDGTRHRLRELREVQPGRQLPSPRRLVGPRAHRHLHRRDLRPERQPLRRHPPRLLFRQAVRPGHDAAHGQRVPGRHGQAVHPRLVRAPLRPVSEGHATSGRTRTTTRASPSTRRPAFPGSCTSRT